MLTNTYINYRKAGGVVDASLGNRLFRIAGIIGIATKNSYDYGFPIWDNQEYFVNPLPLCERYLKPAFVPKNFKGYDFGFYGFNFPDERNIEGEFGSPKYFEHCTDLIRHYFLLRKQCEPVKNRIIIHYRNYPPNNAWTKLGPDYYLKALKKLPDLPTLVVTDNIDVAYKNTGIRGDYTSNTAIEDFYILANADYLVIANSTFSWWGAWLSQAMTVAPARWFTGEFADAPIDLYLKHWILV
jgi:hypothetical protein